MDRYSKISLASWISMMIILFILLISGCVTDKPDDNYLYLNESGPKLVIKENNITKVTYSAFDTDNIKAFEYVTYGGNNIYMVAFCNDGVVCYNWNQGMSCLRHKDLNEKYCNPKMINNTGDINESTT